MPSNSPSQSRDAATAYRILGSFAASHSLDTPNVLQHQKNARLSPSSETSIYECHQSHPNVHQIATTMKTVLGSERTHVVRPCGNVRDSPNAFNSGPACCRQRVNCAGSSQFVPSAPSSSRRCQRPPHRSYSCQVLLDHPNSSLHLEESLPSQLRELCPLRATRDQVRLRGSGVKLVSTVDSAVLMLSCFAEGMYSHFRGRT